MPSRAQAALEKIQKHSVVQRLYRNQASKPSRTSTLKSKSIRSRIIQTICPDPKVYWNQAQKPQKILTNHKSMKLYRFKSLKHRRTSTTNLQRRRMHEEHTKNKKNVKNKEFLINSQSKIHCNSFQRSSIHSSTKLKNIFCSSQNHITTIPINKSCKEIKSENHSFVISENCTTQSSIQICICETILLV